MTEKTHLYPGRRYIATQLTAALIASGEYLTGDPQGDAEQAVLLLGLVEAALLRQQEQGHSPA